MDSLYVIACGIVWAKTDDPEAGEELVLALGSDDEEERCVAQVLLAEAGPSSIRLLERALTAGRIKPQQALPCMQKLMQRYQTQTVNAWCAAIPERNELRD